MKLCRVLLLPAAALTWSPLLGAYGSISFRLTPQVQVINLECSNADQFANAQARRDDTGIDQKAGLS